jgi:uncharacterized protein YfaS (alpha-2-macroglobulin family)
VERGALAVAGDPAGQPAGIWRSSGDASRRAGHLACANLPGIRPQFASKAVYDYRTDTTVNQPIVDENGNASFDIVYADASGAKKQFPGYRFG